MQTCCSFKSAIFWVCKNCNWNSTHFNLTRHYSTNACATTIFEAGNVLQTLHYLHLAVGVRANSSSVILWSYWMSFDRTSYKHKCKSCDQKKK
jgi:hypothetical protein